MDDPVIALPRKSQSPLNPTGQPNHKRSQVHFRTFRSSPLAQLGFQQALGISGGCNAPLSSQSERNVHLYCRRDHGVMDFSSTDLACRAVSIDNSQAFLALRVASHGQALPHLPPYTRLKAPVGTLLHYRTPWPNADSEILDPICCKTGPTPECRWPHKAS
jgi:hypothetical protein